MKSFLDQSAGYLINMTALLLKREMTGALSANEINVTPEQWAILNRLSETSGLSQKEVARRTFKDNANITRILDKLEKKGYVKRQMDAKDRRVWKIYITKEGKYVRNQIEPLAKEILKKATKGIDTKDVEVFNATAEKMLQNLGQ
ncbi:MarR family winged helix-turn-helix transcriptional regulator [Flagellimonas pacifica]|uniref:DNA-binding transcriptional regulator, MarR family n=1 Tax=Flagellimonas pacifica TaxID=1247520 RepID=A0A285MWV0_9FLAO|nr:MarR family transcriptional regulator [Allomuricauda parva]SNZ01163.1 DNA-binding transcriptional regulator, MarR family [Allomuricauda parva]